MRFSSGVSCLKRLLEKEDLLCVGFVNLVSKKWRVWDLMRMGSVTHSPSIANPFILERFIQLLMIPWKKLELSSPSKSHLILAFCLRSFSLRCSISAIILTFSILTSTSVAERGETSALRSISYIFSWSSRAAAVSVAFMELLQFLRLYLRCLSLSLNLTTGLVEWQLIKNDQESFMIVLKSLCCNQEL